MSGDGFQWVLVGLALLTPVRFVAVNLRDGRVMWDWVRVSAFLVVVAAGGALLFPMSFGVLVVLAGLVLVVAPVAANERVIRAVARDRFKRAARLSLVTGALHPSWRGGYRWYRALHIEIENGTEAAIAYLVDHEAAPRLIAIMRHDWEEAIRLTGPRELPSIPACGALDRFEDILSIRADWWGAFDRLRLVAEIGEVDLLLENLEQAGLRSHRTDILMAIALQRAGRTGPAEVLLERLRALGLPRWSDEAAWLLSHPRRSFSTFEEGLSDRARRNLEDVREGLRLFRFEGGKAP